MRREKNRQPARLAISSCCGEIIAPARPEWRPARRSDLRPGQARFPPVWSAQRRARFGLACSVFACSWWWRRRVADWCFSPVARLPDSVGASLHVPGAWNDPQGQVRPVRASRSSNATPRRSALWLQPPSSWWYRAWSSLRSHCSLWPVQVWRKPRRFPAPKVSGGSPPAAAAARCIM